MSMRFKSVENQKFILGIKELKEIHETVNIGVKEIHLKNI